jgi:hypothetical protein
VENADDTRFTSSRTLGLEVNIFVNMLKCVRNIKFYGIGGYKYIHFVLYHFAVRHNVWHSKA